MLPIGDVVDVSNEMCAGVTRLYQWKPPVVLMVNLKKMVAGSALIVVETRAVTIQRSTCVTGRGIEND